MDLIKTMMIRYNFNAPKICVHVCRYFKHLFILSHTEIDFDRSSDNHWVCMDFFTLTHREINVDKYHDYSTTKCVWIQFPNAINRIVSMCNMNTTTGSLMTDLKNK